MPDQITTPYPEPAPTPTPAALAAATVQARAVVVYGQPACVQCDRTKAWLKRKGVQFTEVDITTDPAAHRFVTEVLGYRQVPVVIVEDPTASPGQESSVHWSGYRPDRLGAVLAPAVTA